MKKNNKKSATRRTAKTRTATEAIGNGIDLNSMAPDDPVRKIMEGIHFDADSMLRRKRAQVDRELNEHPVQQLEEDTWKMLDFLNGFDLIPFWNFADHIHLVKAAFDTLEQDNHYKSLSPRVRTARDGVIELIQHIGFYRDLIVSRREDLEQYLKDVQAVNMCAVNPEATEAV